MRFRTSTHRTHTLTIDDENGGDDIDLELAFEPYGDPLVHRVGNKIAVAYLVQDSDCDNPMENNHAEGMLWTRRGPYYVSGGGLITDNDREVFSALGLNGQNEPDMDQLFDCAPTIGIDGIQYSKTTLRDLAADEFLVKFKTDDELQRSWLEDHLGQDLVVGHDYDINLVELRADLVDCNGSHFWEEIDTLAHSLYSKHWQAIAGPGVVPISYWDERGSTIVRPTSWDGDPDDLPDGVWVADSDVDENIVSYPPGVSVGQIKGDDGQYTPEYGLTDNGVVVYRGTLGACWAWMKANYSITATDTANAYIKYAEGVLEQYSDWATGDCFGATVELYEFDEDTQTWGEAEGSRDNECWGFIGSRYAEETLKTEFFEPAVKELEAEVIA